MRGADGRVPRRGPRGAADRAGDGEGGGGTRRRGAAGEPRGRRWARSGRGGRAHTGRACGSTRPPPGSGGARPSPPPRGARTPCARWVGASGHGAYVSCRFRDAPDRVTDRRPGGAGRSGRSRCRGHAPRRRAPRPRAESTPDPSAASPPPGPARLVPREGVSRTFCPPACVFVCAFPRRRSAQ